MNTKHLLLVLALVFVGCQKKHGLFTLHQDQTLVSHKNVLVAGQSNAGLLVDSGGMDGWRKELGSNDTAYNCGEAGTSTYDWQPNDAPMRRCLERLGDVKPDVILWYQ